MSVVWSRAALHRAGYDEAGVLALTGPERPAARRQSGELEAEVARLLALLGQPSGRSR